MISSLEDLVAPLTEAEYLEILRAGKLTLRRGLAADRFTPLLDWATLWKVIESDVVPLKKLLVTRKGHDVPAIFYRDQGKLNAAKLASLIPHGISLIATSVDAHVPTLQALCANIQARIGRKINVTAVMTTGDGGAFPMHYDVPDVVVVQVEGAKRWRIYDRPVANPVKGMPRPPKPSGVIFDEVLQPGDFLCLPAGYWHHCDNGSKLSLHLSVLFKSSTASDGTQALLQGAVVSM
jgi:Cupin superfamily protein